MSDKKIILGIDGGGTNTTCILFNNKGHTLDTVVEKGSNLYVFQEKVLFKVGKVLKSGPGLRGCDSNRAPQIAPLRLSKVRY